MFYSWIRGGLADRNGEDFEKYDELKDYLLKAAKDNDLDDLIEDFKGNLLPSDELCGLEEEIMAKNDEDTFWFGLYE
jgi:hypothetical protein